MLYYIYKAYKYICVFLLIIYFFKTFDFQDLSYNKILDGNEIFQKGRKKIYLKNDMVNKFNSYIKLCIYNKLINKTFCPLTKKPLISAIMPIYNAESYLYYSLPSIQNQNMKNIEIIIIDDCSFDSSIKIIEKYMKNDPRIRLIKNLKNRKILYSKSIAALNSNGEYIIELDQDDMFIRDDVFQILYNEAKFHNLDLVQMRDFVKTEFFFEKKTFVNIKGLHFIYPKNTHFKTQPELKDKIFTENNNYLLWGLLINADLYKKAIYHLWPLIINYKIIFNEDYFITSMIVKLANNYEYLNKFALIHLDHKKSISTSFNDNNEYYLSFYFYIYYLYEE